MDIVGWILVVIIGVAFIGAIIATAIETLVDCLKGRKHEEDGSDKTDCHV